MDKNIQFINDFYENPKNISDDDLPYIEKILDTYKREIVEDKYILFVGDNDNINKLFILFLFYNSHVVNNESSKKHHCGLDFEFNAGKVALMQLNFGKYIWVLDPKNYDKNKIEIINKKLLLNNKIYKVLHGADSLDLPYMFLELFGNDKSKILRFMKRFIDTRFLCEYVRSSKMEEGKCSIYDAMLYFGTITKEKYDELEKINETMGPIQDVMWSIKKLSSFHIKYAFYDVLHLLTFLNDIYKKIIKETPELVRSYYYVLQLIRFVILERKGVTGVLEISKAVVNPMNNYIIKTKSGNVTLINTYNNLMEKFSVNDESDNKKGVVDFNFIEKLNYVKGTFSFLLKYTLYYICTKKYKVYKNKNEIMTEQVTLDKLYGELEKIKMYKIVKLLKLYENEVIKRLKL